MADSIYWELGRGPQVQFSVRWNFICCNTLISFRSVLVPIPTLNKRSTHIVIFKGHRGASRKSPNNTLWITLNQGSVGWFLQTPDIGQDTCRVPAHPWLYSEYLQGICIPLTLVRIPAGCLHTPDCTRNTCRLTAYPWHWSEYERKPYGERWCTSG